MLSKTCEAIAARQQAGKDLTEAQDQFVLDIDHSLEDFWCAVNEGDKRKLRRWFAEPFLSEFAAAAKTLRKGWDALDKLAQHV